MSRPRVLRARWIIILLLAWTLIVCYPAVWKLPLSLWRVFHPVVEPEAVADIDRRIAADDPADIERAVLELMPYQYDWQTYGMPWYFPTTREAAEAGAGDCKSRFVVLAAVSERRGIPYKQRFSLLHFWIEYPGKESNAIEAPDLSLISRDEDGRLRFQRARTDWSELARTMREAGWDAMPKLRKWLLIGGWVALGALPVINSRRLRARRA